MAFCNPEMVAVANVAAILYVIALTIVRLCVSCTITSYRIGLVV